MGPWAPRNLGPLGPHGPWAPRNLGPLGPHGAWAPRNLGPLGPMGPWARPGALSWQRGPGLGPSVGSVGPAWGPQPAARARARPGALNQSGETLTKKSLFGVFGVNI